MTHPTVHTEQPDPDEEWTPALQAEADRYAAIRYEQQSAAWLRLSEGLEARGFPQETGRSVVDAVFAAVDGLRAELDALRHLADRGLLPPEGGETRDRFMVQTSGTCWPCDTEAAAWAQFARVKAWPEKPAVSLLRQSVTEWPDGRAHFGPWEPVHD